MKYKFKDRSDETKYMFFGMSYELRGSNPDLYKKEWAFNRTTLDNRELREDSPFHKILEPIFLEKIDKLELSPIPDQFGIINYTNLQTKINEIIDYINKDEK